MDSDNEMIQRLKPPRPSIMELNLFDPRARANFIAQKRQEQTPSTSKFRAPLSTPKKSVRKPSATPTLGAIYENELFQTPVTSKVRAPTIKKETFLPATSFDFNEAKDKPVVTRPSIMDVNLLDPIQRANFIAQKRLEQTPSTSKFKAPLSTPKKSVRKPSATPILGAIHENESLQTPVTSKTKKKAIASTSKIPIAVASSIKKVTFLPATSFDFNEAKDKPVVARPSIMDVNLLDPIQRANFIAQKRLEQTPSTSKFRAPMSTPMKSAKKPSATPILGAIHENKSLQTPVSSKIKKEAMASTSKTPIAVAPTIKKETFVAATNFDFNEAKDKPIVTRPSIMDVNLLDPIQRANFIARRKEYEQQCRQGALLTGGNKENL